MLNQIIRFALKNRLMIIGCALAIMVMGTIQTQSLSIDVFPELTRPRVTLVTECPGLAPEEVEQLVTFPLETAINGANGVTAVRSSSDIGLSVITVEFGWNSDVYIARQIVQERMAIAMDDLPEGIQPQLGPMSSLLGQIMLIGMYSETGETTPMQLRTEAEWVVRQRLRTIEGISQVIAMGGELKQYQVLVDRHQLHIHGVALAELETALSENNLNVTGGYLDKNGRRTLVRGMGRLSSLKEIRDIPVKRVAGRTILVSDVAEVVEAAQVKFGDSTVNGRDAVVFTVQKQNGADTRALTDKIKVALAELKQALPADVALDVTYQQREFIDYGIENVTDALYHGAILVVVVLFLFLLNFRTTFITLTAIPLSILITALIFRWWGLSINVMTLGGIAVAMGELVDDAIVDVENIFQRLRQNANSPTPRPALSVIYEASVEVRSAIILSTVLVVVVFAPLFALSGMSGRMFVPLGIAYIISILASTVVSLTVTPVLSYYLLPKARVTHRGDGFIVRFLKMLATPIIRFSLHPTGLPLILCVTLLGIGASGFVVSQKGWKFLPDFDEGATQVNVITRPGTSLSTMRRISSMADERFSALLQTEQNPTGPLLDFTARMGRAEQDEHVMGVNMCEYVMSLNKDSGMSRGETMTALRDSVKDLPGISVEVEQPIAHLISHMLSGVTAQIAIKLYGDDLATLRSKAEEIQSAISDIDIIEPPVVEAQRMTSQFRIEVRRDKLAYYGVSAKYVQDFVETAMNGRVISDVVEGQRRFELLLRMADRYRTDVEGLARMPLELPTGEEIPLSEIATLYEGGGPSVVKREKASRRIVVRVNTKADGDLSTAVDQIKDAIDTRVSLPEGYYIIYGGQFEEQRAAVRKILTLSLVALAVIFIVLYSTYPSTSIVLQLLFALPVAFVGGVIALVLTKQSLNVATVVGFISLGGIAARNGLLLVSTYLDRLPEEGFTPEMILNGSLERLSPVLMTALTTGVGLVPLVIGGQLPGKEILFPVATVILGGLVTSTLCEFLIRPGLFLAFSDKAAKRIANRATKNKTTLPEQGELTVV